jgi:tetratricopeptide (TPR) repeat protein
MIIGRCVMKLFFRIIFLIFFILTIFIGCAATHETKEDAEAYYNRGNAYKKNGQYDKAISDFTKAIEINPRHADAYYTRGVVYYYKKDYEKALDDFYKAQKLGNNVPPEIFQLLRELSGKQKQSVVDPDLLAIELR